MTRHQSSNPDTDDRFSLDRRRLITGTLGLVTAGAALPLLSATASAHFPSGLDIVVSPDSESNELDPTSDETVTVAVLYSEFEVEHDGETETETFDPTEMDQRYRFGAADAVASGGGARPVGDGTVRDVDGDGNDDLLLEFPIAEGGFSDETTEASLYWERSDEGAHGYSGTAPVTITGPLAVADVDILNYALTLEHLQHEFYHVGLHEFSERDFEGYRSPAADTFDSGRPRYGTYQQFERITEQKHAHVEALTAAVEDLGGEPVEAAEYDFGVETVDEFVQVAARIADVGVSAYRGVAPFIDDDALLGAALSIHSVQARHAAYLRQFPPARTPFPNVFDPARSMAEVRSLVEQFLAG